MRYVAWQCDQDAYASIGQKCSAQSILFAHSNWVKAGILDEVRTLAAKVNNALYQPPHNSTFTLVLSTATRL